MSKFYVLPPRPAVGRRFADFLSTLFPGLQWDNLVLPDLADALSTAAGSHPDVFVVHREDLGGMDLLTALTHSFGAEPGDEVIEFLPGEPIPHSWRIDATPKQRAA